MAIQQIAQTVAGSGAEPRPMGDPTFAVATLSCLHCGHQSEWDGPTIEARRLRCSRCAGNLMIEEIRMHSVAEGHARRPSST